jgi:probable F420-dependent oxidoreductase
MKIGVQFPNEAIVRDVAAIRDFAQTAEGLGYSHLLIYEHVIGVEHANRSPRLNVPYNEATEFHESLVLLGFLSAVTSSIGLTTGIVVLPQRQTGLVAKQAAEIAILSEDRLRLGVGVGWNYVEFEVLNEDFSSRGPRSSEQIELLRMFWSQPVVDFRGKWHMVDRAGIAPRPRRPIPLWIGGFSEPAYRRAAKLADGLIYSLVGTSGADPDPKGTIEHVRSLVEGEGRKLSSFGVELLAPLPMSPGDFAALVDDWSDTAIDYLTLHLQHGEYTEPGEHIAALETYMKALGSRG